jgi:hypothetical protein
VDKDRSTRAWVKAYTRPSQFFATQWIGARLFTVA